MAAKKWSRVSQDEVDQMRRLRNAGNSLELVAKKMSRSVTAVTRATSDIPSTSKVGANSGPQVKYTDDDIRDLTRKANLMKSQGQSARVISDELGIPASLVGRLNQDTRKGQKKDPKLRTTLSATAYKKQQAADRERNSMAMQSEQSVGADGRVTFMPVAGKMFNVNSDRPDPRLVENSKAVIRTWISDTREGRLTNAPAHTINQAALVIAEDFTIHDYEVFLSDRPQWQAVREYTQSTTEQIADMVGISASSISRYEHAKRSPEPGHRRLLHDAYVLLLERYIDKVTWTLVQQSYVNTFGLAHDDVAIDTDELLMWVTQGQDDPHDIDINHITYLHEIRRLLPVPAWREPTPRNLWLSGMGPRTYAEATMPA